MGFLTPALLAGGVLVAVPLVLHLIMRRQPQTYTFPALRFVQQRRESNQRRMRLRHWLLLALRCALIGGLALALARPTLRGSGLHGKEGAPLAVALVFDNSPRMQYVHGRQTRLQQAQAMAAGLVERLPADTSVAVLDRGRRARGHLTDASAAGARLKGLSCTSHPRPLGAVVRAALELVDACEECRQEVFLFTDMTRASMTDTTRDQVAAALAEAPEARMYLVDVGIDVPHNLALGNLRMRSEVLTPGEPLHMELGLQATAAVNRVAGSDRTAKRESTAPRASQTSDSQTLVELYLNDSQGQAVKRGQQWYDWNAQDQMGPGKIVFELADLPLGTHQGSVQLALADPLLMDNTRYFTAEVHAPARILLVGETDRDTLFVRAALSPSALGPSTLDHGATGVEGTRANDNTGGKSAVGPNTNIQPAEFEAATPPPTSKAPGFIAPRSVLKTWRKPNCIPTIRWDCSIRPRSRRRPGGTWPTLSKRVAAWASSSATVPAVRTPAKARQGPAVCSPVSCAGVHAMSPISVRNVSIIRRLRNWPITRRTFPGPSIPCCNFGSLASWPTRPR